MSDMTLADFEALPDIEKFRHPVSDEDLARWAPEIAARFGGGRQPDASGDLLDLSGTDLDASRTDAEWALLFPLFSANNWRFYWANVQDPSPFFRWSSRIQRVA